MRFCEECGAQLEDDAKFCDECGTPVAVLEEEPVAEVTEMPEETEAEAESAVQNDTEEVKDVVVHSEKVEEPRKEKQPKPVKTSGEKINGGSKKKVILIAAIVGVLLVVGIVIGIVLAGKGDEDKGDKKDPVKQENVNNDDSVSEDEDQEAEITQAVVGDNNENSKNDKDKYPMLEEFIDIVCSYSDPPSLEGDAWDEYFKELYDSWASGQDFTNIVVGEDGHLVDMGVVGTPYGYDLFEDVPYGVYTVVGQVGNLEYGFRVTKEKTIYSAELVYVNAYGQFFNALEYNQDGIYMGEENSADGIINETTGEWVEITFVPYEDGDCWFTFVDYYDGTSTVIVDEILTSDSISWRGFDNYQDYYTFLWN